MAVADKDRSFTLTGAGDVLEPEDGVVAIGSGGNYALAAARALMGADLTAEEIARRAMDIAADICVYTNNNVIIETHVKWKSPPFPPARSSPSSTASSSARTTPSAPSPSPCATAGAASSCPKRCARRSRPRTS